MKNRFYKRNEKYIIIAIIAIMIASFIFAFINNKRNENQLSLYTSNDKVPELKNEKEKPDINMQVYEDTKNGFTLGIPSEWKRIDNENEMITYVHKESGASLQIETSAYKPNINSVTADSESTNVATQGYTFINFEKFDSSSYQLTYQDIGKETFDYIEEVFWNRKTIVKLKCIFNDKIYDKISTYYDKILKSFTWNVQEHLIPPTIQMLYNSILNFEVGVPKDWIVSQTENAIIATNSDTTITQSITSFESNLFLDQFRTVQLTDLVKSGKDNFVMGNYDSSHEKSTMTYSYMNGNQVMQGSSYFFANGKSIIQISFEYVKNEMESELIQQCISLFRFF